MARRSGPSHIAGMEMPASEITVAAASRALRGRKAARMPSGRARISATTIADVASATVDGSASTMREATVRRRSGQVWPSEPSATFLRKRPNCTING